jgi:CRP/FNR family transcriptional regulator
MSKVISMEVASAKSPRLDDSLSTLVLQGLDSQRTPFNQLNIDAGQMLFNEGERPKCVLLLLDGQVKLSMDSADGKRMILRIAAPEEILGLASAFTGMPHELTAETITLCRFVSLQCDVFQEILHDNPRTLSAAARELAMYYSHACRRLQMLGGTPSVLAKLARMLLEWSKSGRQTTRGVQIHLGLSHREVGEFIGATRETVSRAFSEFERQRVVQIRGSLIIISNLRSLEGYAGVPIFDSDERI